MPLCGGHELLAAAERGGYAVPGFNVSNIEMIQGVIAAAEAKHAAVFLQFNPSNLEHMGGVEVTAATARAYISAAGVPIALHLDHGPSVDLVRRAVRAGFSSLMFDGSTFPLERNQRETMEAYAVAAEVRLALEAELGHVGGREPGVATSERVLTDPESAARFVEDTRVDSLAVSVGTAHGLAGEIDVPLLREIRAAVRGLPLVLHGGSGVTPADMRLAVEHGIRKVNISSELHSAFTRAVAGATGNDPRPALRAARDAVAQVAEDRIDLLGAAFSA
ncbi:MAG: class II fructose-bisphosphate aldolase [Dehalococcoidia bacterium]|nr:class II fructose-bisphosphate aldolase [Dehalococcoidia bacterium]MCA9849484.1 class II fructose-bisphosphate aldolase [Dehalococcoidia bacterium]MCB9483975.1 class II fructose-bisphosphate aldolase [Dehalococcoidia bacterium]